MSRLVQELHRMRYHRVGEVWDTVVYSDTYESQPLYRLGDPYPIEGYAQPSTFNVVSKWEILDGRGDRSRSETRAFATQEEAEDYLCSEAVKRQEEGWAQINMAPHTTKLFQDYIQILREERVAIEEYTPMECTCHTGHPPCSFCVEVRGHCDTCAWGRRCPSYTEDQEDYCEDWRSEEDPMPEREEFHRLEYIGGGSRKFWECWLEEYVTGYNLHVHWGRIGTGGQSKSWNHLSRRLALADLQSRRDKKTDKGYSTIDSPGIRVRENARREEARVRRRGNSSPIVGATSYGILVTADEAGRFSEANHPSRSLQPRGVLPANSRGGFRRGDPEWDNLGWSPERPDVPEDPPPTPGPDRVLELHDDEKFPDREVPKPEEDKTERFEMLELPEEGIEINERFAMLELD